MYLSLRFCAVIWRRWILVGVTLAGVLMTLAPAKAQVTYVPERIDQLDGFIRRIPCIDQNAYQVIDDRIKYLGIQLDLLRPPPGNLPNLKAELVSARALLNSRYKKCRQKEAAERPWQTPEFLETVIYLGILGGGSGQSGSFEGREFSSNRVFLEWAGITAGISESFYDFDSVSRSTYAPSPPWRQ